MEKVVDHIDALWVHALPTLARLVTSCGVHLPFWDMCTILCGTPFFGEGGATGYCHAGPYHVDSHRIPAFWAKEIILDCIGLASWGGRDRADMQKRTPVGNGSRRGLGLALEIMSEESGLHDIPTLLLRGGAEEIMLEIYSMRSEHGCEHLVRDLHDVQWNYCDLKKVLVRTPRRLRREFRSAGQPDPAMAAPAAAPASVSVVPEIPLAKPIRDLRTSMKRRKLTDKLPEVVVESLTKDDRNSGYQAMRGHLQRSCVDAAQAFDALDSPKDKQLWLARFLLSPSSHGYPAQPQASPPAWALGWGIA